MWKNTNGLKFCHWKIHLLGVQSHFSPKVLSHRIFLPLLKSGLYTRVLQDDMMWVFPPLEHRHENFQEKAEIPAFLVKIYAFSFLFMMFWAFLTRFPAFFVKSPSHAWEQKRAKKKKKKSELTTFRNFLQHDMTFCYPPPPLFSHTLKIDDEMIGLIDLSPFFNSLSLCQTHRRRNDLQCGGGGVIFLK